MDNIGDILVLLTLTAMRCGQLNGQMHSATLQPSGDLAPIRSNWTRSASTNITQGGRLFTVSPPVLFQNPSFDNFLTAASQMDTLSNRVLELNLLPACVPPCRNGGFCRKDEKQNTYFCLCPQDYTGSTCEMSKTTPLESCDDYTCKNGGICVGSSSQPNCSCPTEVMGKFCERRVRTYEVYLQVFENGRSISWNKSFEDRESPVYRNVSSVIVGVLQLASKLGDDQLLVQTYYATEFKNFYNGSVWAIAQVKFDLNDTLAARYTQAHVQAHLITGGTKLLKLLANTTVSSPTDFGQINISTFVVHAVDPCTAGRHDCSVNAICKIISPGIYTCECNTFTIDVSNDNFYPGRRCVYDGLIIFTFIVVGGILSMLIFVLCGCRRTIWYRYGNRQAQEHLTLVNMPANYEI